MKSLITISAMLVGMLDASVAVAAPEGEQQLNVTGYLNGPGSTYTDIRIRSSDLSAPIFLDYRSDTAFYAAASAIGTPNVTGTVVSNATATVRATAGLFYYLQINGPAVVDKIPIVYTSRLTVNAFEFMFTGVQISQASATFTLQEYTTTANGAPFNNLSNVSWGVNASSNFNGLNEEKTEIIRGFYSLGRENILLAAIDVQLSAQNGGGAFAYADPYFYIEPSFIANNPGYSLSFSPFAGNDPIISGVPELSTWASMLLGLGIVGLTLRRRNSIFI